MPHKARSPGSFRSGRMGRELSLAVGELRRCNNGIRHTGRPDVWASAAGFGEVDELIDRRGDFFAEDVLEHWE